MNRFTDKRVLLTGAASGIGRATASRLVAEGATVFGVDRDADGLEATGKLVDEPVRFSGRAADLSDEQQTVEAVAAAAAELGRIDVLVNAAGVIRTTPIATLDLEAYRGVFDVNLFAPVLVCHEALPHIPDNTGVIVNVTSTAATKAHPGMSAYAASKGALLSFTVSLAAELAPRRIRVVPVSPGGTATPLTANRETYAGIDTSFYARARPVWGEMGRPEQLAGAIAFAASDDAGYFNGVELRVDGGSHL